MLSQRLQTSLHKILALFETLVAILPTKSWNNFLMKQKSFTNFIGRKQPQVPQYCSLFKTIRLTINFSFLKNKSNPQAKTSGQTIFIIKVISFYRLQINFPKDQSTGNGTRYTSSKCPLNFHSRITL